MKHRVEEVLDYINSAEPDWDGINKDMEQSREIAQQNNCSNECCGYFPYYGVVHGEFPDNFVPEQIKDCRTGTFYCPDCKSGMVSFRIERF